MRTTTMLRIERDNKFVNVKLRKPLDVHEVRHILMNSNLLTRSGIFDGPCRITGCPGRRPPMLTLAGNLAIAQY